MTKLTKAMTARIQRLAPNGIPRWIRVYDNGNTPEETVDRYTVVFTGRFPKGEGMNKEFPYLGMSAAPFHPQGFGQHGSTPNQPCDVNKWGFAPTLGRKNHLGKRIPFADLPKDCQLCVWQDYADYWSIPNPLAKTQPSVSVVS